MANHRPVRGCCKFSALFGSLRRVRGRELCRLLGLDVEVGDDGVARPRDPATGIIADVHEWHAWLRDNPERQLAAVSALGRRVATPRPKPQAQGVLFA